MDCPLSFHDSEEENYDAENQENSNPNIFNVDRIYRNRDRGLRGKAFRFNGKVTGFTFSDNSRHGRIREFNTKLGDRLVVTMQAQEPLQWISYVVFCYEISYLSSSAETCDIPVTGYIQSTKQVYKKALQTWMGNELEWQLVPGGLCGSAEFTKDIVESGEELVKYTVHGQLGFNVFGRREVQCFLILSVNVESARPSERQPEYGACFVSGRR